VQTRVQTAALEHAADRLRCAAADAGAVGRRLGLLGYQLDEGVLAAAVRRLGDAAGDLLDVVGLDLDLHAGALAAAAEDYATTEQSLMAGVE